MARDRPKEVQHDAPLLQVAGTAAGLLCMAIDLLVGYSVLISVLISVMKRFYVRRYGWQWTLA